MQWAQKFEVISKKNQSETELPVHIGLQVGVYPNKIPSHYQSMYGHMDVCTPTVKPEMRKYLRFESYATHVSITYHHPPPPMLSVFLSFLLGRHTFGITCGCLGSLQYGDGERGRLADRQNHESCSPSRFSGLLLTLQKQ